MMKFLHLKMGKCLLLLEMNILKLIKMERRLSKFLLLFLLFASFNLTAQQPGVRQLSGGGYTFDANAYKNDMEKRKSNSASSSFSDYSQMGFRSLREIKAEQREIKKASKAVYDNISVLDC